MSHKIYVASSWRNVYQPIVVVELRKAGHSVYDFRNPAEGDTGFSWASIDPNWVSWTLTEYKMALKSEHAALGFRLDFEAMNAADTCVLVLPCGRSAHLEAGWFVGCGLDVYILSLEMMEPELMYKMTTGIYSNVAALLEAL